MARRLSRSFYKPDVFAIPDSWFVDVLSTGGTVDPADTIDHMAVAAIGIS